MRPFATSLTLHKLLQVDTSDDENLAEQDGDEIAGDDAVPHMGTSGSGGETTSSGTPAAPSDSGDHEDHAAGTTLRSGRCLVPTAQLSDREPMRSSSRDDETSSPSSSSPSSSDKGPPPKEVKEANIQVEGAINADYKALDKLVWFFRPGPAYRARKPLWESFVRRAEDEGVKPNDLNDLILDILRNAEEEQLSLDPTDKALSCSHESWDPLVVFGPDPLGFSDLLQQLESTITKQLSYTRGNREVVTVDLIMEPCVLPGGPCRAAKSAAGKWRSKGPTADHEHAVHELLSSTNGGVLVLLHVRLRSFPLATVRATDCLARQDYHFVKCAGAFKRADFVERNGAPPKGQVGASDWLLGFQFERLQGSSSPLLFRIAALTQHMQSSSTRCPIPARSRSAASSRTRPTRARASASVRARMPTVSASRRTTSAATTAKSLLSLTRRSSSAPSRAR